MRQHCILISNRRKYLFVFVLRMHYHDISPTIFYFFFSFSFSWYPCEDICAINFLWACLAYDSEWLASLLWGCKFWVTSYVGQSWLLWFWIFMSSFFLNFGYSVLFFMIQPFPVFHVTFYLRQQGKIGFNCCLDSTMN